MSSIFSPMGGWIAGSPLDDGSVILHPPEVDGPWRGVRLGEMGVKFRLPEDWIEGQRNDSAGTRFWVSPDRTCKIILQWGLLDEEDEIRQIAEQPARDCQFELEDVEIEDDVPLSDGSPACYARFRHAVCGEGKLFFYSYTVDAGNAWVRLAAAPVDSRQDENSVYSTAFPILRSLERDEMPRVNIIPADAAHDSMWTNNILPRLGLEALRLYRGRG